MKLMPFKLLVGIAMCAALFLAGCQHAVVEDIKQDNASKNQTDSKPSQVSKQVAMIEKSTKPASYNKLTKEEERVIIGKGTEWAWKGEYTDLTAKGTYICRRCNAPLYTSDSKFDSDCGWPSFDDEMKDAVERHPDPDGERVEIVCKNCGGHLGHVFEGERKTAKNIRHCVNSISVRFIAEGQPLPETIRLSKEDAAKENASIKSN